jgi:hypothetical protein
VAQAPQDAIVAQWITSKLLLREGKIDDGMKLLAKVSQSFPEDLSWWGGYESYFRDGEALPKGPGNVRPRLKSTGELGALLINRRDYVQSLDQLLRGGYWLDAAYIAERVLTADELKAYVDKSWPDNQAEDAKEATTFYNGGYPFSSSQGGPRKRLRYLLGRRLIRGEQAAAAVSYLPKSMEEPLKSYVEQLQSSQDSARSPEERGAAALKAAAILRQHGLELIGTELDPDWFAYEGNFELAPVAKERQNQSAGRLASTPDELARAGKSAVTPDARFHYRYKGAELVKLAATLLPKKDKQLCAGVKDTVRNLSRDEKAANEVRKLCR